MANCNDLFQEYHSKIDLSSTKKESLRKSRDSIRNDIKKYFKDTLERKIPRFYQQGSFAIKTVVNPLSGEYDVDDGVYLQDLPEDKNEWPRAEIVHKWIMDAVKGRTNEGQEDKKNCVRVIYKNNYHVDLPIYGTDNGKFYIAKKGVDEWPESDPKAFTDWFLNILKNRSEQLRRNIKYLKAWADYKSLEFPSIAITILAAQYHGDIDGRDDKSTAAFANSMVIHLKNNHSVNKPVAPFENVLAKLTENQIDTIIKKLEVFRDDAVKAIECAEDKIEYASKLWNKHFGDRFPIVEDEKNNDTEKSSRTIHIAQPAKPWSNNELAY